MFLGIDLGTSSIKLVLIDAKKNIINKKSAPLTLSRPHPLWSEQDPEDWWLAFVKAFTALKKEMGTETQEIKAIGLSGQQHGAVLLDKNGEVLRPAILWNDGRSFAECMLLETKVPDFERITGNKIMPGFTAPKLLWVYQHEPQIFAKTHKVLLPKDYLRYRLSGDFASDLSDSAGTCWLHTGRRRWSETMLKATHLDISHMPTLYEGTEFTSTLAPHIAKTLGLSPKVKIVAGAGDNAASAVSMNVIKSGSAFLSLGTSGVYFVSSDTYRYNAEEGVHTFCHAVPKHWHHMAVHLSAAVCLDWWGQVTSTKVSDLVNKASRKRGHDANVFFLPYLSGERTPHNDPHARGVFAGMSHATTNADMTQAVMEGVVFAFMSGQAAMLNAGIKINEVSVVGGGARFPYWGKLLAAALRRPLIYRKNREVGGAYGAALLAWVAEHGEKSLAKLSAPPVDVVIKPEPRLEDYFAARFAIFNQIYQQLKPIFPLLTQQE
jgi:xylulokinase